MVAGMELTVYYECECGAEIASTLIFRADAPWNFCPKCGRQIKKDTPHDGRGVE